jgi:hypothetical protein
VDLASPPLASTERSRLIHPLQRDREVYWNRRTDIQVLSKCSEALSNDSEVVGIKWDIRDIEFSAASVTALREKPLTGLRSSTGRGRDSSRPHSTVQWCDIAASN